MARWKGLGSQSTNIALRLEYKRSLEDAECDKGTVQPNRRPHYVSGNKRYHIDACK